MKLGIQKPVIRLPKAIAKGGKPREIPIWQLPTALLRLPEWKAERRAQDAKPAGYFVCSQATGNRGKRLDRRNARARFISCCRALGQERAGMLTIHDGRHTCASHLLAGGWSLPAVRDMLGHANIATTSVYSHTVVDDETPPDPFAFINGKEAPSNMEGTSETPPRPSGGI